MKYDKVAIETLARVVDLWGGNEKAFETKTYGDFKEIKEIVRMSQVN